MADDLEVLVCSTEGESPTPAFVAKLRAEIERASIDPAVPREVAGAPADDGHRHTGQRPRIAERLAIAAVVAVVGLLAARQFTVDDRAATHAVADAGETLAPLRGQSVDVEPGTHRVDTLGTAFTFVTDRLMSFSARRNGMVELAHVGSQGADDRTILFSRLSRWSDPSTGETPPSETDAGDTPQDAAEWLARAERQGITATRSAVVVDGRETTRLDLEVPEPVCPPFPDNCLRVGSNGSSDEIGLRGGSIYRMWIIDQGDEDPILVRAAVDRRSEVTWLDDAERIVASLSLGGVEANPVLTTGAGATDLPFLGGIRIELAPRSYATLEPSGLGRIMVPDWSADTAFFTNPISADGAPVSSIDALVDALESEGVELHEFATTSVDGASARVFDLTSSDSVELALSNDRTSVWSVPPRGRLWLIEHLERGVVVVVAEAFESVDIVLPLAIEQTEALLESLRFAAGD
ncbi:MAG: hypothetical protein R2710_04580 [Acidimicrobiales bacterium]